MTFLVFVAAVALIAVSVWMGMVLIDESCEAAEHELLLDELWGDE